MSRNLEQPAVGAAGRAPRQRREGTRRQIVLLSAAQALFLCSISVDLTVTGIVGYELAPTHALATLPFALITLGAVVTTVPASLLMARVGRRTTFLAGTVLAAAGGAASTAAVSLGHFGLFCAGTACIGVYQGCAGYYRYAAADQVAPERRGRAISTVLAGGVVAAVAGPFLAKATVHTLDAAYAGSYLLVTALAVASALVLCLFRDRAADLPRASARSRAPRIPLRVVFAQRGFVIGTLATTTGYFTMMVLMTVAPVAALRHGHSVGQGAAVIQWHMVGMYAPALVAGPAIKRIGAVRLLLIGVCASMAGSAVAYTGGDQRHFMTALGLVGVGWSVMYASGTTLIAHSYRPETASRTQAVSESLTMGAAAAASLGAAALLQASGWTNLNLLMLAVLVPTAVATLAFLSSERRGTASGI
ncbi:MFS transporter [Streptomyces sp. 8N706]|uniref:MFS transporter n=1 Tax=Streptomyces sp. 8N706 TaxID=3457416 RepID=UPI003FD0B0EA